MAILKPSKDQTLNSNLILLIPGSSTLEKRPCFALNSNLILLIRRTGRRSRRLPGHFKFQSDSINTKQKGEDASLIVFFKFQSDSINTRSARGLCGVRGASLNSNLILLIRISVDYAAVSAHTLNSNLILLIHRYGMRISRVCAL